MTAQARLALTQDLRQILDVEFAVREQGQQAQTGRLAGRSQYFDHVSRIDRARRHWRCSSSYKHIFISF